MAVDEDKNQIHAEHNSSCSSHKTSEAIKVACSRLPSQHALRVTFALCLNVATAILYDEWRSLCAASGAPKTSVEQLSFCAKFQAGAAGAQTCSSQDGALAIHTELCEAIPNAI